MKVLLGVKDTQVFSVGTLITLSLSQSNKYLALADKQGEIVMFNLETEKIENRMSIDA